MPRYRLHTTGAGDGTYVTREFPYTHWRQAFAAAADYSTRHGHCVVQSDQPVGPRGDKRLPVVAVFAYGHRCGR